MTVDEDKPIPILYEHCMRVYNTMLKEAHKEGEAIVYEGFLTKLVAQLNLSTPYYTFVRKRLIAMGCIRQLRRGGSSTPSQWELVYEPTEEAFFRADSETAPKKVADTKYEVLAQQISELTAFTVQLKETMDAVVDALAELHGVEVAPAPPLPEAETTGGEDASTTD